MNTFFKTSLLLGLSMIAFSCESAPKPQAPSHWDDPAIAKAGWKQGQIYKTLKRGGVAQYGNGYYALNTENTNSRVAEAWRNPEYKNKYLAYKVAPGALFQAVEVRYSRYSGCYSVYAIQLPYSQNGNKIHINLFEGGKSAHVRGRGLIVQRDPNYLVPVEMPMDSGIQTSNAMPAP